MNYYRFIDTEEALLDFMVNEPEDDDLKEKLP